MKAALISFFFILLSLVTYQISKGGSEKLKPMKPPIDMAAPTFIKTASFGLG